MPSILILPTELCLSLGRRPSINMRPGSDSNKKGGLSRPCTADKTKSWSASYSGFLRLNGGTDICLLPQGGAAIPQYFHLLSAGTGFLRKMSTTSISTSASNKNTHNDVILKIWQLLRTSVSFSGLPGHKWSLLAAPQSAWELGVWRGLTADPPGANSPNDPVEVRRSGAQWFASPRS